MARYGRTPKTNKEMMAKLNKHRDITIEGCWIWTGCLNNKPYGRVSYKGVLWLVHRLSFYLYKPSEFTEYGMVCHKCNVSRCFNPEHLYMGDNATNQLDAVKIGTHSQAGKTMCPRGHLYDSENTHIDKRGYRVCKECELIHSMLRIV